jgi:hypothetical protein
MNWWKAVVLVAAVGACAFGQGLTPPTQLSPIDGKILFDTSSVPLIWQLPPSTPEYVYVHWEFACGRTANVLAYGYGVGLTATTILLAFLSYDSTYFWRLRVVQTTTPYDSSVWTPWWRFTMRRDRPVGVEGTDAAVPVRASVYPNPFGASMTVRYFTPGSEEVSIEVVNVLGQRLFSETCTSAPGWSSVSIPFTSFAAGVYFCTVRTSTGTVLLVPMVHYRSH